MHKVGEVVLDLKPGPDNHRNSEGAFLELKDGRILFIYSRYLGEGYGDDASAYIAARISSDGGNTWNEDEIVAMPEDFDAINLMSVSLLRMSDGDIGLFYLIRKGWHDTRLHLFRSSDEGETWGEPVCCIPGPGLYVTNNDRVIRLSTGRLVVPAAYHKMSGNSTTAPGSWHFRSEACFFLSDDDGRTWRASETTGAMPEPNSRAGLQEAGVIELKDGRIWSWSRTDTGRQYEMFSSDGGDTWSVPVGSIFTSPNSPLSMKRIPHTGQLLAVWNPIPNYQTRNAPEFTRGRTPLVGAISPDEGKVWVNYFSLESEENGGGYCYTAIHFTEDSVLLAYCAGIPEDRSILARLRIRKISLDEIL